jgi:O-antigen ligase
LWLNKHHCRALSLLTYMFKSNINNLATIVKIYWPCFIILLAFIGFISKSLYNYPVSIMALLGLYQFIKNPKDILQDPTLKTFSLVFLCLWLPLLISFPDAVNQSHSARTVFPYLRFLFAGIFIIKELSKDPDRLKFIIASLFYIVLFWCVDATIQFLFKKNLLGFPYEARHITGMFYPRNTISHVCSILSAFSFLYIYTNLDKNKYLILSILPLFFILLLSGRRAAWVMLALSSFAFLTYVYIYTTNKKRFLRLTGILISLVSLLLVTTIVFHPPTNSRLKVTLGLFSNDYASINAATATRLPIWETSYEIFKSNLVNGIGPRGFRHVYKDYALEDDYYVKINQAPTQPHIILLEVLTETGLIGFLGYLLSLYIIVRVFQKAGYKQGLFPFFIPVVVTMFPFNTHMAFYGSIISSMVWLLISLYFAKAKLNY